MIYEITGATIKHNFPRSILMTCWERYFIKLIAPGMVRETQPASKKRVKILTSNLKHFCGGGGLAGDKDAGGPNKSI